MHDERDLHGRRECLLDEIRIELAVSHRERNQAVLYHLREALAETEAAIFHECVARV